MVEGTAWSAKFATVSVSILFVSFSAPYGPAIFFSLKIVATTFTSSTLTAHSSLLCLCLISLSLSFPLFVFLILTGKSWANKPSKECEVLSCLLRQKTFQMSKKCFVRGTQANHISYKILDILLSSWKPSLSGFSLFVQTDTEVGAFRKRWSNHIRSCVEQHTGVGEPWARSYMGSFK